MSGTCYRWAYGAMYVPTIYTLVQNSIWEWRSATNRLIWESKYSDFILNALIVIIKFVLKPIQKTMTILWKMVEHEIISLSKMRSRHRNWWKRWENNKNRETLWSSYRPKLMILKGKCSLWKHLMTSKI